MYNKGFSFPQEARPLPFKCFLKAIKKKVSDIMTGVQVQHFQSDYAASIRQSLAQPLATTWQTNSDSVRERLRPRLRTDLCLGHNFMEPNELRTDICFCHLKGHSSLGIESVDSAYLVIVLHACR